MARDPLGLHLDLTGMANDYDMINALAKVVGTKHGRAMFQRITADPRTCTITAARGSENAYTVRTAIRCDAVIDPSDHPMIETTAGRKPASTTRIMAHELGHLATGIRDL